MAGSYISPRFALSGWFTRLVAKPGFQNWVSRTPGLAWLARRDGAELFTLVQGFVSSQVLFALVSLDLPRRLMAGPAGAEDLAQWAEMPADRLHILLQAGAGIGVLKRQRDGRFALTRKGAALQGVPGLRDMILHHATFYRDLADPVALLRGDSDTELARIWPYVLGSDKATDPKVVETYSNLMAESQAMVARDTLQSVSVREARCLMDVGGGAGVFLTEAVRRVPGLRGVLFDLPAVGPMAEARIAESGLTDRIAVVPGSFRDDALPTGADVISLIRVLYDHQDETVDALLRSCFTALPAGGRVIVSEPMSGGARPDPATDVYFALYTRAMQTGRTRSAAEICDALHRAGFENAKALRSRRPYITSVVTADKPA